MSIDATKIQFDSNLSIDKIAGIFVGTYDLSSVPIDLGYLYKYTIAHSFRRPFFCELLWSIGGQTFYDGGSTEDSNDNAAIAFSDSNNIYIYSQNIATGVQSGLMSYKVICSWIDDYDDQNPLIEPVIQAPGSLYFDSKYNYLKIYQQGEVTLNKNTQLNIQHNLNYVPRFKVFFESNPGQVWPMIAGGVQDIWLNSLSATQFELYAIATSTELQLYPSTGVSGQSCRAWYRIYYGD